MNWFPDLFWLFLEWALLIGLGFLAGVFIGWLFWRRRLASQVEELEYKLDRENRERAASTADHDHALTALRSRDETIDALRSELEVQGQTSVAGQPLTGSAVSKGKLATARINGLQHELARRSGQLAVATSGAVAEREQAQQQVARFGNELANTRNELALSSQRSKQLAAELETSNRHVGELRHQVATTTEQTARLQAQLDSSVLGVGELEASVAAADGRVSRINTEMIKKDQQLAGLQTKLDEAATAHALVESRLSKELAAKNYRISEVQGQLDRSTAEVAQSKTDLIAREGRAAELQKGLDARTTRIVDLQRQLNAAALTVTHVEETLDLTSEPAEAATQARNLDYTDNLKPVVGIGQRMSGRLEKQGIVNYYQLATLPPEEIKQLAKRIGVRPRRIKQEKWIEQAIALHYKKHGEQIDLR